MVSACVERNATFEFDRRTFLKLANGAALTTGMLSGVAGAERPPWHGNNEHETKLSRLDTYLSSNDLESVWFADSDSYVWLTGHSNIIDRSSSTGVAAVGYDGDTLTIVVDNDERALVREELFDGPPHGVGRGDGNTENHPHGGPPGHTRGFPEVDIVTFGWHASSVADTVAEVATTPAAADFDVSGFDRVNATALRQPLTESERETYRSIGEDTARALESVCKTLRPDDTEREAARAVSSTMDAFGLEHPVVLVAGEERAQKYRHPVPTDAELNGYVSISVVGRRAGLYASCTRTVAFDPPEWFERRTESVLRVDATALGATRRAIQNGGTAGDVFEAIQTAYAHAGVPDEWKLHHQGGGAGYASREWVATPDDSTPVTGPMAYAWNPTLQGTKSEGTVLISASGYEPVTLTGEWPTRSVESYVHDEVVVRPGVLYVDT